ncbi:MAG: hypothetical protein WBC61_05315, partial [Dehalococcoidia bacterium]
VGEVKHPVCRAMGWWVTTCRTYPARLSEGAESLLCPYDVTLTLPSPIKGEGIGMFTLTLSLPIKGEGIALSLW